MLNEASHLDPKAINNWLDLNNETHLRAFRSVLEGKFWPIGFLPDDVVFPTCWINLIQSKIVNRWLDEQLKLFEDNRKPCNHVCPTCGIFAENHDTSPHCTLCGKGI